MTAAPVWPNEPPARLLQYAAEIPAGPWVYRRSLDGTGALILWDALDRSTAEPLALIYAGTDLAKYLCTVSPAALLGLGG